MFRDVSTHFGKKTFYMLFLIATITPKKKRCTHYETLVTENDIDIKEKLTASEKQEAEPPENCDDGESDYFIKGTLLANNTSKDLTSSSRMSDRITSPVREEITESTLPTMYNDTKELDFQRTIYALASALKANILALETLHYINTSNNCTTNEKGNI